MRKYWSAAMAMLFGAITVGAQTPPPAPATSRSYEAGRFGIELTAPTTAQQYIQSVTGGQSVSEVVAGDLGAGGITKKHVAGVNITPLTVRGEATGLLTTFRAALDQPGVAFDGRIVTMDYDYKIHEQLSFARAMITQIILSALDASSKEPATVELTLAPEQVKHSALASGQFGALSKGQMAKAALGFQLQMPGLDDAMSHVTRVESIRMMQTAMTGAVGAAQYARSAPARWQYGNIVITLPLAHAEQLNKWRQQLLAGSSTALDKTLDLHLSAGAKELLVLHATGVSLVSMREVKSPSNESWVQAELIVQHWDVGQTSSIATGTRD